MRGFRLTMLLLGCCALAGGAAAQESVTVRVSPHVPPSLPPGQALQAAPPEQVPGTLRLPRGAGRVPAVVILHSAAGVDGRGEPYAQALQAAGIASLELDMWQARGVAGGTARGASPRFLDTLPDLFGALRALAAHPRIDPQRLGVMGQSFGASMAMLATTEPVWRTYGQGGPPLRAALALYPGCFRFEAGGGSARFLTPGFPRVPLLLLVAEQDDYDADGGASCRTLMTRASPEAQARATLHIYPGATHGWDVTRPRTIQEAGAARGQGGMVRMQRSPSTTEDSLRRATTFFTEQLAAR